MNKNKSTKTISKKAEISTDKNQKESTYTQILNIYSMNGMDLRSAIDQHYICRSRQARWNIHARLLKDKLFMDMLNDFLENEKNKANIAKDSVLRMLYDISTTAINEKKPLIAIKAIEVINKMKGFNSPDVSVIDIGNFDVKKLISFDDDDIIDITDDQDQ